MDIKGKKIILGVTGGIAAYKALELVRLLKKEGALVWPVMTRSATEFVTPLSFATLSGNPAGVEMFSKLASPSIDHIELACEADLFVVVPATANFLGKAAGGIADSLLTTLVMASPAPLLVAPAMNERMYENAAVKENIEKLRKRGVRFVGPSSGELACGREGRGRLAPLDDIMEAIKETLAPDDLVGERVLVTAGATREALDPVRYLSNASSGLMGYELARAARRRGAEVILISGPSSLPKPPGVTFVNVESAIEMHEEAMTHFPQSTVVVMAAAVSDYKPVKRRPSKVKKDEATLTVDFERTVDILKEMGRGKDGGRTLVGFSLETEDLVKNATGKLRDKNLDMVVANGPAGLSSDTNEVTIIDSHGGTEKLPPLPKQEVAEKVLDAVVRLKRG